MKVSRKRLLSGMQPTASRLHLGNYEGALKNWVRLQDEYDMFCFVADWHALTTMIDRTDQIRPNAIRVAGDFIAAGIDPSKSVLFLQSDVKEHAELYLLFSMATPLGWLERVPTFKENRDKLVGGAEASHGLLGYPVLQAVDILIYKPYGVPVGKDQVPHLELTREIARRYNFLFGDTFPEIANVLSETPILMGTDGRKMSKSYGNTIDIFETDDETRKKMMTAYTDPEKIRKDDPGHPDGCSVFAIHAIYNKPNLQTVETECKAGARGCVSCKKECIDVLLSELAPLRERRAELDKNQDHVLRVLQDGAEKASEVAADTLRDVRAGMKFA